MRSLRNWGRYCSSPNCCIRSVNPNLFCPATKLTKDSELPSDYMVNYQYEWLGYNLKPLEIQSAMLFHQMDKISNFSNIRRKNYRMLHNYMKNTKVNFKLWDIDEETSPFSFPFLIPENCKFKRKHLIDHLKKDEIECRVLFGGNLMKHPAYSKKKHLWQSFGTHDNSDIILNNCVMLGVSQINTEEHIQKVITSIDDFIKKW